MSTGFDPYDEFTISKLELDEFKALLKVDPLGNLAERFRYFTEQNARETLKSFGFVPRVMRLGYTCAAFDDDEGILAYSIGYYYSTGFPELMMLAPPDTSKETINGLFEDVGSDLMLIMRREMGDVDGDWRKHPVEYDWAEKSATLSDALWAAQRSRGLQLTGLKSADDEFLDAHPYGFGWYFYRHFMDTVRVPLVLTRLVSPELGIAPRSGGDT